MKMTSGGFKILRDNFGSLTQSQVDGFNFLIEEMRKAEFTYPETAYALATVWHETNRTIRPIVEFGSKKYFDKYDTGTLAKRLGNTPNLDGDGFLYRGRGYVQITGTDNYKRIGKLIGINLMYEPDLALNKEISAKIMIGGMKNGWFTGLGYHKLKLGKYDRTGYVKARAIINGSDKASLIADYAMVIEKALRSL